MIFPDYHLHSEFSTDSTAALEEIIRSAKENGLTSLCLTDHHDLDFPFFDKDGNMEFQLDLPAYHKTLAKLRDEVAPDFDLRIGIELGIMPSTVQKGTAFAKDHTELDFIICSTHIVDGMDPYYPDYFEKYGEADGYRRYFEVILEALRGYTDFDVYGHLDYVVRYGPNKNRFYDPADYREIFEEILKIIIDHGRGIELNTGSLYRGLDVPHPHIDLLKLYKKLGGEIITVGSDAHTPDRIGYGFDVARDMLLAAGFTHYTTFKNRKAEFHPIPQGGNA